MRYPGGMSENFRPGGMSDDSRPSGMSDDSHPSRMSDDSCPGGMSHATHRKGVKATWHFFERIPQVGESLERKTGLVGCMDVKAWVSGFNGYAKE